MTSILYWLGVPVPENMIVTLFLEGSLVNVVDANTWLLPVLRARIFQDPVKIKFPKGPGMVFAL